MKECIMGRNAIRGHAKNTTRNHLRTNEEGDTEGLNWKTPSENMISVSIRRQYGRHHGRFPCKTTMGGSHGEYEWGNVEIRS